MQAFKPAVSSSMRPGAVSRPRVVVAKASTLKTVSLPVKTAAGADAGTESLSVRVAEETARGLVHRYMVMVQQNARRGTASTQTRAEVAGGGKKPYAQKGTGNARRGSNTSPLFPGGGISFGPKPKDWSIRMNKKERRLALATALQSAHKDMIVVDKIELVDHKTKALVAALETLGCPAERKTLVIVKESCAKLTKAGGNLPRFMVNTADSLSVFDVLHADRIVVEKAALAHINAFYGAEAAAEAEATA
ncbi:hypothetical protein FOA52_003580 [Chlamydomonas sp. UWO 241]|nr:hypothetical protein FOA52_003580 [Chlamydomonas sp. UWO 241]